MTVYEVLEIFNNPKDLHIFIIKGKKDDKYALGIFRGPGHNFKPLITSSPFTEEPENAIKVIKVLLEAAVNASAKLLKGKGDLPDVLRCITDPSNTLNASLIERILDDLRRKKVANTFEYK